MEIKLSKEEKDMIFQKFFFDLDVNSVIFKKIKAYLEQNLNENFRLFEEFLIKENNKILQVVEQGTYLKNLRVMFSYAFKSIRDTHFSTSDLIFDFFWCFLYYGFSSLKSLGA